MVAGSPMVARLVAVRAHACTVLVVALQAPLLSAAAAVTDVELVELGGRAGR